MIDSKVDKKSLQAKILAHGIDAVPGAAVGKVVFTAAEAEEWAKRGEKVILVRRETSPEDVGGMAVAQGILTATGGKTCHAAVVARGWGKCCIVGAETLDIDYKAKTMKDGKSGKVVKEGEWLTLDGSEGIVYVDQMPLVTPELPEGLSDHHEVGRRHSPLARAHQRGYAAGRAQGHRVRRGGHRAVPHRAHVLHRLRVSGEEPRTPARHPGNDPGRRQGSA